MKVAVVGHVEWIEFARVDHVPAPGEIVQAEETWEEPGGGGAVAAVQLARLNGDCTFYTVLGDDELGRRSRERLTELGVTVRAEKTSQADQARVRLRGRGRRADDHRARREAPPLAASGPRISSAMTPRSSSPATPRPSWPCGAPARSSR